MNPSSGGNSSFPECDIVLKGGVTSGVVYPKALKIIASKYRLRRIAGTSAGAIAAGAAAAAQLGEFSSNLNSANPPGFARLDALPGQLGKVQHDGRTLLETLFQPQLPLRPVYKVFSAFLGGKNPILEGVYQFWLSALGWAFPGMIFLYWQLSQSDGFPFKPGLTVLFLAFLPLLIASSIGLLSVLSGTIHWGNVVVSRQKWVLVVVLAAVILLGIVLKGNINILLNGLSKTLHSLDLKPLLYLLLVALVTLTGTVLSRLYYRRVNVLVQLLFDIGIPFGFTIVTAIWLVEPVKNDTAAFPTVSLVGTVISIWVGFLAGVVFNFIVRLVRELPINGYGFCNGSYSQHYDKERTAIPAAADWWHRKVVQGEEIPLTPWLDYYFSLLAHGGDMNLGSIKDEQWNSLTFQDLKDQNIALLLKTTNLTNQMSMKLPFADHDEFYYSRSEFTRLFPAPVMKILDDYAFANKQGDDIRLLPKGNALPIIIAVRMSLSFPILLSAIKLYTKLEAGYQACWFSDGGITSNFPVSLFDEPLPQTPTFSIDLIPSQKSLSFKNKNGHEKFLPSNNHEWTEPLDWGFEHIAKKGDVLAFLGWQPGLNNLFGFLFSIFGAAQNWRDNSYIVMPGFRDRTARVQIPPDIGGLNLAMQDTQINKLADAGERAAKALVSRFGSGTTKRGWKNHQWIRARTLLPAFADFIQETTTTYNNCNYAQIISAGNTSFPLDPDQLRAAKNLIQHIGTTKIQLKPNPFDANAPQPQSIFRLRPKE